MTGYFGGDFDLDIHTLTCMAHHPGPPCHHYHSLHCDEYRLINFFGVRQLWSDSEKIQPEHYEFYSCTIRMCFFLDIQYVLIIIRLRTYIWHLGLRPSLH